MEGGTVKGKRQISLEHEVVGDGEQALESGLENAAHVS